MDRTLTAPGKLFLSGEYAVLWGGTARVVAVAPRTAAVVRSRVDRTIDLHLEGTRLSGQVTPLGGTWGAEVPREFHFVARAIDLVLRALGREGPGFSLALGPSPLGPQGRKLGMGSSARAVVLAVEATRAAYDARFDTLKLSLLAHSMAQGGKGSGGDVAASFAGGVVRYRRYDLSALTRAAQSGALLTALEQAPPVELWRLPECRLPLAWAFTGQSASTPSLISSIEQRHTEAERARLVLASDALGRGLEEAVMKGDFASGAQAVKELQALLKLMGPIETEELNRLIRLAESYGCAAKISGAGGGDGCVVLCPDLQARAALVEGLSSRGLVALALDVVPGLRGEAAGDPVLQSWLGRE